MLDPREGAEVKRDDVGALCFDGDFQTISLFGSRKKGRHKKKIWRWWPHCRESAMARYNCVDTNPQVLSVHHIEKLTHAGYAA